MSISSHKSTLITIYIITWMVSAFWLFYKCVFIVLWSMKMMWTIWLAISKLWEFSFTKEIKLYTQASYTVFFFNTTKNKNFTKEFIKHVQRDFVVWWKSRQSLWEISSRWMALTVSCPNFHLGFYQAMKPQRTYFIS